MAAASKNIWTIGHSTRTIKEFTDILHSFDIEMIVDVRHFPGSGKYPHFNKENLLVSLNAANIKYQHIIDLGGRRKSNKQSENTAWRHPAFRAYADYMETEEFENAVDLLKRIAENDRTAYMCSEVVWWRCHRAMISDYLKAEGWSVWHIMGLGKADEHPYTSPAKITDGKVHYK